jgi:hypothetical protein
VVVDDLDGTMHRAYGMLPNMIYVLDRDGRVAYKAMWTDHADLAATLANLAWADEERARGRRVRPSYVERIVYLSADYGGDVRERVFDRAGPQASSDYTSVFRGAGNNAPSP